MEIIKCLNCGAETNSRGEGTKTEKKFCSKKCATRYISKKTYHRLKNNQEYKEKQRKNFRKWLEKNRDKFNEQVREANKLYQRRISKERREKGLCMGCGGERDSKFLNCEKCREILRNRNKRRSESNGL